MPYDYSSIRPGAASPSTPTKKPRSPPSLPKKSTASMYFEMEFLEESEARSITRLHRTISKLAFWKKRKSATLARSTSKKIAVVPPHSPFFRHPLPLNKTFDTASTMSTSFATPDSPGGFAESNQVETLVEPIVSASSDWWSGDSDNISLLFTSSPSDSNDTEEEDNFHDTFETIWFHSSDLPKPEGEENGEEFKLDQVAAEAEALKEELDEFSEVMSRSMESQTKDPNVQEEEELTMVNFQEDLSVWYRVRERFSRMFFGGVSQTLGPAAKEKENSLPASDSALSPAKEVESHDLLTPKRKSFRMASPARNVTSTNTASPHSKSGSNSSNLSKASKSMGSSQLKLNCSRDEKGMESLELEFPVLAESVDLSRLEEHFSTAAPEPFGFADLNAIHTSQATPITAVMDKNDHCAQLVIMKSETTKPGHVKRPSGGCAPTAAPSSAASSSCFSSLCSHDISLGITFPFSPMDQASGSNQYATYIDPEVAQAEELVIDDSDFHQSFDNETPVARSRRLRAAASMDNSFEGKAEGNMPTTSPTSDSLPKLHVRDGSQDSIWDELESAANTPYDEPCQEEALPDTPQRLAKLQEEAKEKGSMETVQGCLFQPIMKDLYMNMDQLCSTVPTANATTQEATGAGTQCGLHTRPREADFTPYSDADYTAAAAESAAYDNSVASNPDSLRRQKRKTRSSSSLGESILQSPGTRAASVSSFS